MSNLNEKQKRFADEYLIDLNATQAAIRAGYSPRSAAEQASRLLKNVKVRAYIDERMDENTRYRRENHEYSGGNASIQDLPRR